MCARPGNRLRAPGIRPKAVDCQHSELDRKMARSTPKIKLFNGRDHSWMQFNRRVLEEAEDPANPLLERVKFLAITGSNLDEYVEIRQAGLMQRIEDGYREPGYDGLRPDESLERPDRRDSRALWPRNITAGTSSCCRSCASRASGCSIGTSSSERRARVCARILSARSRSAADADLHRSGAPVSARAQQGAVPGAAAARQAAQLRAAGAGSGDGAARAAALCPPAQRAMATTTTCCCRT